MKKRSIFIFAYYSYLDPIFQSAVLPYFVNFPGKHDFHFILLTFEQKKYRLPHAEQQQVTAYLQQHNITWYRVNWHSGSLKLLKKVYDFITALFLSSYILIRHRIDVVYSEGFPGAIISHFLSTLFRKPHVVHSFEPHADYMVEGGVWKAENWEARLLKTYEKEVAAGAFAIMTATGAMIERLLKQGVRAKLLRVPSCVDMTHFAFDVAARSSIRQHLKISPDECVVVCIGKMGGMYWEEELFQFFYTCLQQSETFRFLFYTPDEPERILGYLDKYHIPRTKIDFGYLKRSEVPYYLSAADFGLVHVHQYPSKRFCSPIKDGEYWACGLPIVIPRGVSDDFEFAVTKGIGIVLDDLSEKSFETAAQEMLVLYADRDKIDQIKERCRQFVETDRNVAVYQALYRETFLSAS